MKKRILMLNTKDKIAGAQTVSIEISENLKNDFEFIYLFGQEGDGTLSKFLDERNIKYIISKYLSREINIIKDIKLLFDFYKIIKKVQPDIIHANSVKPGLLIKIFSFFSKITGNNIKYVYHHHGLIRSELYGLKAEKIFLLTERIFNRFINMSVYISSFDIDFLKLRKSLAKKYILIPNGVNYDKFFKLNCYKSNLKEKVNIVFFSRIDFQKKPLEFVQIVSKFKDIVKVTIVGDGLLKDDMLNELDKNGVEYNFIGWTINPEIYLCNTDILINCSITEGFPLAIVEAAMCGNIILASNIDGNNEVKKYISDIYIYKDINEAQYILKDLIINQSVIPLKQKATQDKAKNLSSKNMAHEFKVMYNKILEK